MLYFQAGSPFFWEGGHKEKAASSTVGSLGTRPPPQDRPWSEMERFSYRSDVGAGVCLTTCMSGPPTVCVKISFFSACGFLGEGVKKEPPQYKEALQRFFIMGVRMKEEDPDKYEG